METEILDAQISKTEIVNRMQAFALKMHLDLNADLTSTAAAMPVALVIADILDALDIPRTYQSRIFTPEEKTVIGGFDPVYDHTFTGYWLPEYQGQPCAVTGRTNLLWWVIFEDGARVLAPVADLEPIKA